MNTDSEDYYFDGISGSTFSMSVKNMYSSEIRKKYSSKVKPDTEETENGYRQDTISNPGTKTV